MQRQGYPSARLGAGRPGVGYNAFRYPTRTFVQIEASAKQDSGKRNEGDVTFIGEEAGVQGSIRRECFIAWQFAACEVRS